MENEPEKKQSDNKEPVNWTEKIKNQNDSVKKLDESFKKNPSDELRLELDRETDTLRHYTNAANGNPKERAKATADLARKITLDKAIQQLPPEE